jgi:FkbM family methyltransferase
VPLLQSLVMTGHRYLPRGWSPAIRLAARLSPSLHRYRAAMTRGDTLLLDLREPMCHGYFFFGSAPQECGVETLLRQVLRPGDTFLDIGANIGFHTALGSRLVGPTGHVVAFEPMPAALELLKGTASSYANVEVVGAAVGLVRAEATFYVRPFGDTSSLEQTEDGAAPITVPVVSIDEAVAAGRIALIKIDVEGFELDVLRGARATIARHRPVVCFEFIEDVYAARLGFGLQNFRDLFYPMGYRLYGLERTTNPDGLLSQHVGCGDVVAIPEELARGRFAALCHEM